MNHLAVAFECWQARPRKYAVHGGMVWSYDGETHYIAAHRVMRLYGLNLGNCVLVQRESHRRGLPADLIHLGPRSDGNYTLP